MADLAEATSGVALDGPATVSPEALMQAVAAVTGGDTPTPVRAAHSDTFLDKTKNFFGSASSSASAAAARVSSTASENSGLMWIILAAMVAAGFFIFASGGKKKSVFKFGRGRKPSGGSFSR